MTPTRGDGLLTSAQVDRLIGGSPGLTRKWRQRGWITPDGLDERGLPLYYPATARMAERKVTENGLRRSGVNPRQLRQRAA
jgi:hypothetical protein